MNYNFIISFDNPEAVDYPRIFPDNYSCEMAKQLARNLSLNSDWKKVMTVHSDTFSNIAFYVKKDKADMF